MIKLRKTESAESLLARINKAELEIKNAHHFDHVLVNKDLDDSFRTAQELLDNYMNEKDNSESLKNNRD